ncbi:DNA polymerase eta isoform X2 [Hydra vulgaris]|nr:DNA polymerase eta isoform X2 [Hydra vulgaris]
MRGDEAKEKCPDIHLVPVPENRGKADLTQFREAGAEVIEILAGFADCLERASVDEAYMDLTELINRDFCNYDIEEVALHTFQNTNIVGIDNMVTGLTDTQDILKCDLYKQWHEVLHRSEENLKLAIGATIADKMRKEVKEKLGFTCSAGIGQNKMLAKIVAGFHKPDQQTLVLPDNVAEMFQSTKMRKIRSLGGKLGKQLAETFNVEYMSDLLKISSHDLEKVIGKKSGDLVYGLCRGIDYEPVRPRQLPKSVGCSKNFNGKLTLSTTADVYKWLRSLSEEVYERLEKEKVLNQRFASLITVGCVNSFKISQSRRCSQIKNTINDIADESFRALSEFNQSTNETDWHPPIINLHLTATKFQTMVSANKSIDTYMTHDFTGAVDDLIKINLPSVKPKNKLKSNISNFFSVADRSESNKPLSDEKQFLVNKMITPSVKLKDTKKFEYWNKFLTSRKSNEMILDECSEKHIDSSSIGKQHSSTELNYDSINTKHDSTERKRGLSEPKFKSAEAILSSEKSKHFSNDVKSNLLHSDSITKSLSFFSKFCQSAADVQVEATHGQKEIYSQKNQSPKNNIYSDSETYKNERKKTFDTNLQANKSLQVTKAEFGITEENNTVSVDDIMVCEKCEKQVIAWNLPEHMDFHYAKEVQDSFKNNFLNLYKRKEFNGPPKKKLKQDIQNFFSCKK